MTGAPIHIVMAARMDREMSRHDCPFPGCRKNLPGSVPACKKHRKAWTAQQRDGARAS